MRGKGTLIDAFIAGGSAAVGGVTTGAVLNDVRAAAIGGALAFGIAFFGSLSSARKRDRELETARREGRLEEQEREVKK
jgi:hypothetical protein